MMIYVILKYNKSFLKLKIYLVLNLIMGFLMMKDTSKTRVKTFVYKFTDNEIPKENTHYSCIAPICVDSVIKLEK